MDRVWITLLLLAGLVPAQAAVSPEQARRLDGELTPMGAERAGNADDSIPAWDGGLTPERLPAGFMAQGRYVDPWPDEKPLFTITRDTLANYEARLTPGQRALFSALPDDFGMPVYAAHRSAAAPAVFYAGSRQNAEKAHFAEADGQLEQAAGGVPFPIIGNESDGGLEAIWNHRLRWRGRGRDRIYVQATVAASGDVSRVRFYQRSKFSTVDAPNFRSEGSVVTFDVLAVLDPARLAGSLKLTHETLKPPYYGWQRSPGPDRPLLSRTSEVGGDVGVIGADGLLNEDQREGYSGSPDRYKWKLLGKREIYVPYNAYRLHRAGLTIADLLGPRHLNLPPLRYELHRVWVVEATLPHSLPGVWTRRRLYLDEDSWQILLVELYGRDDQLLRVQEIHTLMAYDQPLLMPALETVYDLPARRYLATGIDNDQPESIFADVDSDRFMPEEANRWARRIGAIPLK